MIDTAGCLNQEQVLMLAHDLRGYLTCIDGYAEHLRRSIVDPSRAQNFAERITHSVQRALAMLRRLEQEQATSAGKGVALVGDLVHAAVLGCESLFWDKGIALKEEIGLQDEHVLGDREQLIRAVTNLLVNAAKFTPRGGTVTVSVRSFDASMRVDIADSGIGLDAEQCRRVFYKFYQVHPHNHGSRGLGLFIARDIIESHGGRIGVVSQGLGRGSIFWFELPCVGAGGK